MWVRCSGVRGYVEGDMYNTAGGGREREAGGTFEAECQVREFQE